MSIIVLDDSIRERSDYLSINSENDFIQKVKISRFEISTDGTYYELEVTNDGGYKCSSRFYLPKNEKDYDSPEKFQGAKNIFLRNLNNILKRFYESVKIEATDFVSLTKNVIEKVRPFLNKKDVYVLLELNETSDGIFTRIARYSPFASDPKVLKVPNQQIELLKKKNSVVPDNEFMITPKSEDEKKSKGDLPF